MRVKGLLIDYCYRPHRFLQSPNTYQHYKLRYNKPMMTNKTPDRGIRYALLESLIKAGVASEEHKKQFYTLLWKHTAQELKNR